MPFFHALTTRGRESESPLTPSGFRSFKIAVERLPSLIEPSSRALASHALKRGLTTERMKLEGRDMPDLLMLKLSLPAAYLRPVRLFHTQV